MYEKITDENAYRQPMRIYPAPHYAMGGLWVDYNLESSIPGLFVLGEANFSEHGANRLGASALMQGLADGYFIIPYTISNYLAQTAPGKVTAHHPEFRESSAAAHALVSRLLGIKGKRTANEFHTKLGQIMWDLVGMERNEEGLQKALRLIPELRAEFWEDIVVPGSGEALNQELEKAGRVADFLEFGELMARDALHRRESCGAHFRSEYQLADGEARRDDTNFSYVAAWQFRGSERGPELHKEPLVFEYVKPSVRSYK